jgi:hypothetical protein
MLYLCVIGRALKSTIHQKRRRDERHDQQHQERKFESGERLTLVFVVIHSLVSLQQTVLKPPYNVAYTTLPMESRQSAVTEFFLIPRALAAPLRGMRPLTVFAALRDIVRRHINGLPTLAQHLFPRLNALTIARLPANSFSFLDFRMTQPAVLRDNPAFAHMARAFRIFTARAGKVWIGTAQT